ncbi:MAG TPA: hypothetical protein VG367_16475 [Mucilaginibacter sp.]|jgi:hypothetical protein|nr:hypothetical protein [Mucilaginibacter sp.]
MKKFKQSFAEVISGQPRKEHYVNVTLAVIAIALVAGSLITVAFIFFKVQ